MTHVVKRPQGKDIPFRIRTRKFTQDPSTNGDLFAVNGVSVTGESPTGASLSITNEVEVEEDGSYLFHWDTSSLTKGTHKLTFTFITSTSGHEVEEDILVQLI